MDAYFQNVGSGKRYYTAFWGGHLGVFILRM